MGFPQDSLQKPLKLKEFGEIIKNLKEFLKTSAKETDNSCKKKIRVGAENVLANFLFENLKEIQF